jgi:hypothetical protein
VLLPHALKVAKIVATYYEAYGVVDEDVSSSSIEGNKYHVGYLCFDICIDFMFCTFDIQMELTLTSSFLTLACILYFSQCWFFNKYVGCPIVLLQFHVCYIILNAIPTFCLHK